MDIPRLESPNLLKEKPLSEKKQLRIEVKHLREKITQLEQQVTQLEQDKIALIKEKEDLQRERGDLEISLDTITEHADVVETELLEARNHLEDQVAERTQELAEKNTLLENEIQERRRIQTIQRDNLIFLQTLLNSIPNPIFYKNLSGVYLGCNHAFEEYVGFSEKQIVGNDCYHLFPTTVADEENDIDQSVFKQQSNKVYETSLPHIDGSQRDVICYKTTFKSADGCLAGLVGVIIDISERKRAEAALIASEERFRQLFEYAPIGILLIGQGNKFLQNNATLEEILGYDYQEFQSMSLPDISCPKELPHNVKVFNQLTAGSLSYLKEEKRFICKNGKPVWCTLSAVPIHDEADKFLYIIASLEDITARKQAEEALLHSEERFELAMRGANDGLWDWHLEDNSMYFAPRWKEMLGYNDEELPNNVEEWYKRVHPDDRDTVIGRVRAYLDRKVDFYEHSYRLQHREGYYIWVLDRGIAVWGDQGKPYRMVGTHMDLTEQKQAEAALIEAKNAAEAANYAKTRFLANMSHELRTPLNAIIGYSEILKEDAEDDGLETLIEDLDKIDGAAKHLLGIISDILNVSKIESGKMDIHFETFNVQSILQQVLTTIDPLIQKSNNQLEIEIPEDLGDMYASATHLQQSLLNLLTNADKFTEHGFICFTVHLLRCGGEDWLSFEVADTGIGITEEQQSKLFKPFTQVDDSSTRQYGGTGLGLVISKHFIEQMGGLITVDSTYGQGSTFTIHLPRNTNTSIASNEKPE